MLAVFRGLRFPLGLLLFGRAAWRRFPLVSRRWPFLGGFRRLTLSAERAPPPFLAWRPFSAAPRCSLRGRCLASTLSAGRVAWLLFWVPPSAYAFRWAVVGPRGAAFGFCCAGRFASPLFLSCPGMVFFLEVTPSAFRSVVVSGSGGVAFTKASTPPHLGPARPTLAPCGARVGLLLHPPSYPHG